MTRANSPRLNYDARYRSAIGAIRVAERREKRTPVRAVSSTQTLEKD